MVKEITFKNRRNEVDGFYLLITTHQSVSSFKRKKKKLIYILDDLAIDLLKDNNIKFKVISQKT